MSKKTDLFLLFLHEKNLLTSCLFQNSLSACKTNSGYSMENSLQQETGIFQEKTRIGNFFFIEF